MPHTAPRPLAPHADQAPPAPALAPTPAPLHRGRWVLQVARPTTRPITRPTARPFVAEPSRPRAEPAPPLPAPEAFPVRAPSAPLVRGAGVASCWGTLTPPGHRHLTIHAAELLLLPPDPSGLPAPITVLPPHPKVRRASLPASALPHLLAGWLATTPRPDTPRTPSLYLLRTRQGPNGARPLRDADGARWTAFGHALRERGDALLVTLPAAPDARQEPPA